MLNIYSLIKPYLDKYKYERCYSGLIFKQGQRTMLQINVPGIDIANLLQAKPLTANNPDSGKDRPEIKGHVEEIKDYVIERASNKEPWLLPTLTANLAPEDITVIELGQGFCLVIIPHDVKLDVTDGQHRIKAISEIAQSTLGALINEDYFPVNLILESNFRQCQIDFRDMAQAKPVEKSLLLSFGEASGRTGITNKLIEQVSMFRGKTDRVKKAPDKKGKLIYTSNYIATLVSCAFADSQNNKLDDFPVEECSQALAECLNQFFSECVQTQQISQTSVEKLTVDEVNSFKKECLLGVSMGTQLLGRMLYCTYDKANNQFDASKVSELAQLDWSREHELWQGSLVRVDPKNTKSDSNYIVFGAGAVGDAVTVAKASLGW